MSIAENFVQYQLLSTIDSLLPDDPLTQIIWYRHSRTVITSWDAMARGWHELLGVNLRDSEPFRDFRGFTDARNAIVHGLGQLTVLQLAHDGGDSTRSRLSNAGIAVSDGRVIVSLDAVTAAVDKAVELVNWLDAQDLPAYK